MQAIHQMVYKLTGSTSNDIQIKLSNCYMYCHIKTTHDNRKAASHFCVNLIPAAHTSFRRATCYIMAIMHCIPTTFSDTVSGDGLVCPYKKTS